MISLRHTLLSSFLPGQGDKATVDDVCLTVAAWLPARDMNVPIDCTLARALDRIQAATSPRHTISSTTDHSRFTLIDHDLHVQSAVATSHTRNNAVVALEEY